MKQLLVIVCLLVTTASFTQTAFPGLTAAQKQKLLSSKIKVPLPAWIPAGFKVSALTVKTGKPLPKEKWQLTVTYSKKLADNTMQEFYIDAGFEGIGDIGMDMTGENIKTAVGTITLFYEPMETNSEGKEVKHTNFIVTEWFDVKGIAFSLGTPELTEEAIAKNTEKFTAISYSDIKKIIKSLRVLK